MIIISIKHLSLELEYKNPQYSVSLKDVDFGAYVNAELPYLAASYGAGVVDIFRNNCLNFLVELSEQMYTRFPFNDPTVVILKELRFIDPHELKYMKSIAPVAQFCNLDVIATDMEFKLLKNMVKDWTITDEHEFWLRVENKTGPNCELFPNIMTIIHQTRIFLHSSATFEHQFSIINLNKTKQRNSLELDTVQGILYSKSFLSVSGKNCYDAEFNQDSFKLFNKNIYQ